MPSLESFHLLAKEGLDLTTRDAQRYNINDTLATISDLQNLFEVLFNTKDRHGNHAVFTPIALVANPDFQKIRNSGFSEYYYEPFTETLKKYPGCENSFDLWKEGIQKKLFVPQIHGREHLNVKAWMKALQMGDRHTRLAFDQGLWGFVPDQKNLPGFDFQAAFLLGDVSELEYQKSVIIEGLTLFEEIFGYRPVYFVPPNRSLNNALNYTLVENEIKYRSVSKIQEQPLGNGRIKKVIHWHGQKDKSGLLYFTRNCMFEPSHPDRDWVASCLNDIKMAFLCRKPAIISTHRVNYIGALHPSNRDKSLRQLDALLKEIIKRWPDCEFMTTAQLGAIMTQGN